MDTGSRWQSWATRWKSGRDSGFQAAGSAKKLRNMSAEAQVEDDFETAYFVDPVEEIPETFKSAMEYSNAVKWKEACDL